MSIISTQTISALNNYNSIIPIVTKDLVENGGRTAMAYCQAGEKTKKYEATEKFIEANMASVLWYGAIPFTKKLFDITVFKSQKLNPEVSLQYLKNGVQNINSVKEKVDNGYLPSKIICKKNFIDVNSVLKNIQNNARKYKFLHISRTLLSTAIPTYLSAVTLPKIIIALTQYRVNKDKKDLCKQNSKLVSFKSFKDFTKNKNSSKPSFKSLGEVLLNKATQAQTSLLGDMVVVDLAISGSRIYYANKREKEALKNKKSKSPYAAALEKAIREGGFLYLIYFGGNHIKKTIDKISKNAFDPVVLEDKAFISELKSKAFDKNPLAGLSEEKSLDFIDKNINNDKSVFIKYGKKLKLIETVKDDNGNIFRNPFKYLDIKKLKEQFDIMVKEADTFIKEGGTNLEKFVNKKIKIKRLGIFGNLIASSFTVCYILPKITYGFRKWYTGNAEEPGIINVINNN